MVRQCCPIETNTQSGRLFEVSHVLLSGCGYGFLRCLTNSYLFLRIELLSCYKNTDEFQAH
jgi:hypothetical protein